MPRNENMIAALKRERAIYVSQGDEDRVRQVDESLKHYGYTPDGDSPALDGDDGQTGPQDRTTAPQQTADQGKTPTKRADRKSSPAASPATPGAASTPPAE
ncbi:hypothetical protein ACPCK1_02855 [Streptomyces pseudogriseolus]|uniref:hypothetical protein n=1 Tax=Streptomyces pseudogriseolus TaxID=36817 RepID=UPI003FA233AD